MLVATADINCAKQIRWHGEHITVDDVVLVGGSRYAAIVQGCFQSSDACWCVVRRCQLKETVTSHAHIWQLSHDLDTFTFGIDEVVGLAAWSYCDDESVLTIS